MDLPGVTVLLLSFLPMPAMVFDGCRWTLVAFDIASIIPFMSYWSENNLQPLFLQVFATKIFK